MDGRRKRSGPGYLAKRTSRRMIGMGIPSNHKRIGIAWLLSFDRSPRPRNETPLVPGPVTKLTTFDRGKTGGECAEQQ
jgi:hypothetical protein